MVSLRTAVRRMFGQREEQRAITGLPWNTGSPLLSAQVSPTQALSLVPVFGAARLLAAQVASLPLQAYRKAGDARSQMAVPSLFVAPSSTGSLYDWLHRCVTSLALRGNAYGLVVARDQHGYPTTVEWLHPDHVSCQDQMMSGPGSYIQPIWYWQGRVLPAEDLVHIPWFTIAGKVQGLSPIEACATTISTGVSAQVYTSDWFNNGAVPPGKFRNTKQTVSQVEGDEIKARLVAAIRSRKPLVFGADWEYDPIAVSAYDARFVETLKLTATQVASIYGIPPEMLGGEAGGSLTYSTVEQNALNLVKFTLRPWLELLEEHFSKLLPKPQYVKFNLDALERADLQARMSAYETARNIGVLSVNDIRKLEDLPPVDEGDDYTPLLVQVASARGIDAAQVKADQPPAGPASVPAPLRVKAVVGKPVNGDPKALAARAAPLSGARAAVDLEARRYDPEHVAHDAGMSRKFNPDEPRIPGGPHGGEWGHGGGLAHDVLKLAGRIQLGKDERLVGSDGVPVAPHASVTNKAMLAMLSTPGGPRLRLGSVDRADAGRWRAANKGGTADLDAAAVKDLRTKLAAALDAGEKGVARSKAGDPTLHEAAEFHIGDVQADWADLRIRTDINTYDDTFSVVITPLRHGDPMVDTDLDMTPAGIRKLLAIIARMQASAAGPGPAVRAAGHDTTPGHDQLHHYWVAGKGRQLWINSPEPWTTLYHHLLKYLPEGEAKKAAAAWMHEVLGYWPGDQKGKNPVGPG